MLKKIFFMFLSATILLLSQDNSLQANEKPRLVMDRVLLFSIKILEGNILANVFEIISLLIT